MTDLPADAPAPDQTPTNAPGEPSTEDAAKPAETPPPAQYDPGTGEQLTPPDVVEEEAEADPEEAEPDAGS